VKQGALLVCAMPVAVEVPGLDAHVPEVPDGRLVLLEGGLAPAKASLARTLGRSAAAQGRAVTLLSTRGAGPDAGAEGLRVEATERWPSAPAPPGNDVVVDSFSLLALDASPAEVAARVRSLRQAAARDGRIAVLVLDDGHLQPAALAACHHLADGVIQFLARDDADGLVTFLRIPKWMDGAGVDKNLFYTFTGRQMLIDTRRRVT
jgi:archaellum biogenesis ATPase FlaH